MWFEFVLKPSYREGRREMSVREAIRLLVTYEHSNNLEYVGPAEVFDHISTAHGVGVITTKGFFSEGHCIPITHKELAYYGLGVNKGRIGRLYPLYIMCHSQVVSNSGTKLKDRWCIVPWGQITSLVQCQSPSPPPAEFPHLHEPR
jgi:hypothetical protein